MHVKMLPEISDDGLDWTYTMRREMQEIIPGLFLGPYSAASKTKCEELSKYQITHIVCIRHDLEAHLIRPNFPQLFRYLELNIADSLSANIIEHIPIFVRFLNDCFTKGGKVLVHGNAGISRSASLVVAYIMETCGLCFREAYTLVLERRFCISPNNNFLQQLKEYELIYRAKISFCTEASPTKLNRCIKRSFDDMMGGNVPPDNGNVDTN